MAINITTDGNTQLNSTGSKSVVRAYGTFASASLTLGYEDSSGTVRAYADNNTAKTSAGEWLIEHGIGNDVYIITTSSTGSTNINVEISKVS